MTALHETIFYDVEDLKVWPMLTDATNASPTYDAAIDVPGVSQVSFDPTITTNTLKGDGRTMASRARLDDFQFKATYGKAAIDVLAAVMAGTVADEGSGTTEVARLSITLPRATGLFAVRFTITDVDLGLECLCVTAFKCRLSGGTLIGSASDSYGQPTLEGVCTQPYHLTNPAGTRLVDFTPCADIALYETEPDLTDILV